MAKQSHPRFSAFELLPENARSIAQEVFKAVLERRHPQVRAYEILVQRLQEISIPEKDIPSFSSFNRHILSLSGRAERHRATSLLDNSSFLMKSTTRQLLAAALRSLADDLESERSTHTHKQ